MKTAELTGKPLDWAVAKCEGLMMGKIAIDGITQGFYKPSTNWAQGGPIIERGEDRDLPYQQSGMAGPTVRQDYLCRQYGFSPLIAAMRCYVVSKLGHNVEIPKELL